MAAVKGLRLAAGPILKSIKNILVPTNEAGKVAYGQLAARYAPDVLYAGLASTMVPPGVSGAERLGIAAEDLGIGLLGSIGGQALGGGAARLAGRRLKLTPDQVATAGTMGDLLVGAPVNMFAPRPVFEGVLRRSAEDEYRRQADQERAQAEASQEMSEAQAQQELISLLLGVGAVGGRTLG